MVKLVESPFGEAPMTKAPSKKLVESPFGEAPMTKAPEKPIPVKGGRIIKKKTIPTPTIKPTEKPIEKGPLEELEDIAKELTKIREESEGRVKELEKQREKIKKTPIYIKPPSEIEKELKMSLRPDVYVVEPTIIEKKKVFEPEIFRTVKKPISKTKKERTLEERAKSIAKGAGEVTVFEGIRKGIPKVLKVFGGKAAKTGLGISGVLGQAAVGIAVGTVSAMLSDAIGDVLAHKVEKEVKARGGLSTDTKAKVRNVIATTRAGSTLLERVVPILSVTATGIRAGADKLAEAGIISESSAKRAMNPKITNLEALLEIYKGFGKTQTKALLKDEAYRDELTGALVMGALISGKPPKSPEKVKTKVSGKRIPKLADPLVAARTRKIKAVKKAFAERTGKLTKKELGPLSPSERKAVLKQERALRPKPPEKPKVSVKKRRGPRVTPGRVREITKLKKELVEFKRKHPFEVSTFKESTGIEIKPKLALSRQVQIQVKNLRNELSGIKLKDVKALRERNLALKGITKRVIKRRKRLTSVENRLSSKMKQLSDITNRQLSKIRTVLATATDIKTIQNVKQLQKELTIQSSKLRDEIRTITKELTKEVQEQKEEQILISKLVSRTKTRIKQRLKEVAKQKIVTKPKTTSKPTKPGITKAPKLEPKPKTIKKKQVATKRKKKKKLVYRRTVIGILTGVKPSKRKKPYDLSAFLIR